MVVLLVGGSAAGLVWLLNRGAVPATAANEAQLVLNWPAQERVAAAVRIDGRQQKVPAKGDVTYRLSTGAHRVVLQRRGYAPIELELSLSSGEVRRYAPEWKEASLGGGITLADPPESDGPVPVGFEGWTQRFDPALARAAREGKSVVMAFVGSDWEPSSARLAREVFPDAEFHRRASQSLVLVVIDLPQTQQAYEQILDSAQNAMLRREYNVAADDVPTIVVLDSKGKPYAIESNYDAATGQELIADLDRWKTQHEERDRLFSQVEAVSGELQLKAAIDSVNWLRERGLTRFYGDRFRQWEQIALRQDPTNAAGQYEVLYEANWVVRWFHAGRNEDRVLIEQIVNEFDQWRKRFEFHDPDRAGRMYLVAAASLFQLGRRDAAAQHVAEGLKNKPRDPQLLAQLQTLSEVFSGEVSSGTGFVVAPGYVLTNNHVIEGSGRAVVLDPNSGEETDAQLVARDAKGDLALLRVDGSLAALPPLTIANSPVGRGARVAAFGFPLGDALGKGLKLTTGVVSALPEGSDDNMYLLDCRINPGNSGGPLCDQRGHVIGMVTAKSSISQDVDSYGMAIPAAVLLTFLETQLPPQSLPATESSGAVLEWDEVDRKVNASVLRIIKKR